MHGFISNRGIVFSPAEEAAGATKDGDPVDPQNEADPADPSEPPKEDSTDGKEDTLLTETAEGEADKAGSKEDPLTKEDLKFPENFEVDENKVEEFLSVVNEAGSKTELVNKMLSLYASEVQGSAEAAEATRTEMVEGWKREVLEAPEFKGPKLAEKLALAKEVAQEYGGPKFLELLNLTGAGNNLSMITLLLNVQKALPKEAKPAVGTPASGNTVQSLAQRLFPQTEGN